MNDEQCNCFTDIDSYLDLTLDTQILARRLKHIRVYLHQGGDLEDEAMSVLESKLQVLHEAYPSNEYKGTRYDCSSLVQSMKVTKQRVAYTQMVWEQIQSYILALYEGTYKHPR